MGLEKLWLYKTQILFNTKWYGRWIELLVMEMAVEEKVVTYGEKTTKIVRIVVCWQRIFLDIIHNSCRLRTRCLCLLLTKIVMKL